MFGVITAHSKVPGAGHGFSIGLRNSNDFTLAAAIAGGDS